jgi:hypothetical protein
VRNGILERHWESTDGRSEVTHIVLPQSKEWRMCWPNYTVDRQVTCVSTRPWIRSDKDRVYYWLQARSDVEKWCRQCDTCAVSRSSRTRNRGQMHQYNVGAPFEG